MNKNPRVRVAGILVKEGKLLLIQHKKNGKEYWLLPGGGVDFGETMQKALKREFIEETNLNIRVNDLLFISEAIDPNGEKHIINFFFEVEYSSGILKLSKEKRLVDLKYIDINKIDNIVMYPNIKKELIDYFKNNDKNIKYIGNIWE
ncbi:ADP-ribose pyrophosphatase YjhB (NUDIX family) [Hypnocyclicus thermotrophus]|uniref:ADP-ribose pyrophosphatase YjhB (NUDIX family) n=1 Tax=Hypnocyclicus thermotrophus TaxID=1627895 RepID=A0AA46I555_9FUSO|nr:NUDIX hydrolase [Hypnocyclicus thermotrophus]TDT68647.1 ADP-ribose pyrophosphatase YjhB (NUDIX family) [Hypnocyclicus thermotrophus]